MDICHSSNTPANRSSSNVWHSALRRLIAASCVPHTIQINSFACEFNIRSNPSEWPIICLSSWMCSHQFIPLKSQIIHIWQFHTNCHFYCEHYMSHQKCSWMRTTQDDTKESSRESSLQMLLIFNAIGFHKNNMSNKCFMCKWNGGGFGAMKGRCSYRVDVLMMNYFIWFSYAFTSQREWQPHCCTQHT